MMLRPFLSNGYRVKLGDKSNGDHWSGGKPSHRGAICPSCDIPLLLLWDINCTDPQFPRRKFGPLKRLPLYFCWRCVNEVAYQIVDDERVILHSKGGSGEVGYPYEPYPEFFERRGLQLLDATVPAAIQRIEQNLDRRMNSAKGSDPIPMPTEEQAAKLADFYGHPAHMSISWFHHQFGGEPMRHGWAEEDHVCPNPACTGSLVQRVLGRKSKMKFLAGVLSDPWAGLPMAEPANESNKKHWNFFVSVQYHICDSCWTVLGLNRCD